MYFKGDSMSMMLIYTTPVRWNFWTVTNKKKPSVFKSKIFVVKPEVGKMVKDLEFFFLLKPICQNLQLCDAHVFPFINYEYVFYAAGASLRSELQE